MRTNKEPLTDEQKDEIIRRYKEGEEVTVLAQEFDRSRQSLYTLFRDRDVPRDARTYQGRETRHGTVAMWLRHYRSQEEPCPECEDAWKVYWATKWETATEEQREAERQRAARWRAKQARRRESQRRAAGRVRAQREAAREERLQAALPETLERLGKSLGLGE